MEDPCVNTMGLCLFVCIWNLSFLDSFLPFVYWESGIHGVLHYDLKTNTIIVSEYVNKQL